MKPKEKNRILKLHQKELLQEKFGKGIGKGGTNSSSSGSYISTGAFEQGGILTTNGREKDIGSLPDEVDITKGNKGVTFNLRNMDAQEINPPQALNSYGDVDLTGLNPSEILTLLGEIYGLPSIEIYDTLFSSPYWENISGCIKKGSCEGKAITRMILTILGPIPPSPPVSTPEDDGDINKPLSLSCCKKCDNGMYTNKCFPFDSNGDEDCRFPTLEVCQDESDPKLPSMLDIFSY